MAFVFRDWLATTESLPLEGIGLLHWERRSAYVSESDSIVYPAQWSLCLSVNAGTQASDTLFERLSCFSRLPVLEIKQQYHTWLSTVKSDQVATDVFGFGTLSKGNSTEWNWAATSLPTMPSVSLAGLPEIETAAVSLRRDVGFWLILIASLLAVGFVTWTVQQKGCTPAVGSSKIKTKLLPDHSGTLPYQEIR